MPLVPTSSIVGAARAARVGAAAFNVIHLETAEALVTAAERTGTPLILQISENCVRYHGGLRPITRATLALAEDSRARVAVHLDHITDADWSGRASRPGWVRSWWTPPHSPIRRMSPPPPS